MEKVMSDQKFEVTIYPKLQLKNGKVIFDENHALAYLLSEKFVFINSFWWKKESHNWSEDACNMTSLNVICNDVFSWGCADSEEVAFDEIEDLYEHVEKDSSYGSVIWCIKKRNEYPQEPIYDMIKNYGIWDLDLMNLDFNYLDLTGLNQHMKRNFWDAWIKLQKRNE